MNTTYAAALLQKAARVRLVIFDVDGVLSDGRIYLNDDGTEFKAFYSQDGVGMKALQASGVQLAIISGRASDAVVHRMRKLGVQHVHLNCADKRPAYQTLAGALALTDSQIAYVGDDLPDLPLIVQAGLGISVPNGVVQVKAQADWLTPRAGGLGAGRDVCDLILYAQDHH